MRKVFVLNTFSFHDYLKVKNATKNLVSKNDGYLIIDTENIVEEYKKNKSTDLVLIFIDRKFHKRNDKYISNLKNSLHDAKIKVVTFVKNQLDLYMDNIVEDCLFFNSQQTNFNNKYYYEYGQLFILKKHFGKDGNAIFCFDKKKQNDFLDFISTTIKFKNTDKKYIKEYDSNLLSFEQLSVLINLKSHLSKVNENVINSILHQSKTLQKRYYTNFALDNYNILKKHFENKNKKINKIFETSLESPEVEAEQEIRHFDLIKIPFFNQLTTDLIASKEKINTDNINCTFTQEANEINNLISKGYKPLYTEIEKHKKIFNNRGFKSDLLNNVMLYVILCRRKVNTDLSFYNLEKIVSKNIDEILDTFNIRYLICIVDTYSDFGPQESRMDYLFISHFCIKMKLIETISSKLDDDIKNKYIMTNGTDPYDINNGDAISNLFKRYLNNVSDNTAKKIFIAIILKYNNSNNTLTNRIFKNHNLEKFIEGIYK